MSKEAPCDPTYYDETCGLFDRVKAQLRITHGSEIARRYLAMNAFDGVLPVLGIIMGGFASLAFQDSQVIFETSILAIFATSFAMLISGITSSYLTEGAERKREIEDLERSLLRSLDGTVIVKATRTTTVVVSLVNGLSPFAAALTATVPLFLVFYGYSIELVFFLSVVVSMLILFLLGLFLGKVSRSNMIVYGFKTLAAGFLVMLMIWFFSNITGY
ncbi:MAG: VIT1/CCC1 transporter family protein [Candidatus Thorarchaeota archaeon]